MTQLNLEEQLYRLQQDYDNLYIELEQTKAQLRLERLKHADKVIPSAYNGNTKAVQLQFQF